MIFNYTDNFQFTTRLKLKDEVIEVVDSTKLLGTIISNDLKWDQNTKMIVRKANARMQLLRKVVSFGTPIEDLKTIYVLFVRSVLEQSATVWHSRLSQENISDLEKVQKSAFRIILQEKQKSYKQALDQLGLDSLFDRREVLCLNFAEKCIKNDKMKHIFPKNEKKHEIRTRHEDTFKVEHANTSRLQNSSIIYMQNLLNKKY